MSGQAPVPTPPPRRPFPYDPSGKAAGTEESKPAQPDQPESADRLEDLVGGLDDLADRPVGEHHDRLAEVHEALHSALHDPQRP